MTLFKLIKKNLSIAIPITMILSIILSQFVSLPWLKNLIIPITFLMIYPMMVTLPVKELTKSGGWKVQWVAFILNFLLIPAISFGLGALFFPEEPYLRLALLLIGTIPTGGMTIAWTGMAKGNKLAAIKITIIGLLFSAILVPFYSSQLLGSDVALPFMKITKQILVVIVVPFVLGVITQKIILSRVDAEVFQNKIKPNISLISTAGVILMVFTAMMLKGKSIVANPMGIVSLIPALLLFYILIFTLSTLIGKRFFNRGDAVALVYGTSMRNLSIILALCMTLFAESGPMMALLTTMAYVIQIQSGALYLKLSTKFLGEVK